jgi:small subunit ribosomal protein S20
MPIIKSAKKRVRIASKAATRNSKTKRNLRAAAKLFAKSPSFKTHSAVVSNLDKSVKKGVMHKNKAARLKRQAAKKAKAAGVKPSAPSKTKAAQSAKKAAPTKKTAPKKSVTKK